MSQLVLSLCDRSGVMVEPWADAGFECWTIDLQEGISAHPNVHKVQADVRSFLPPLRSYAIVFAFPPCTNLAVSGAAWFKDKGLRGLLDGLELVEACRRICEWTGSPWMLENPVSTISSYWREPDYTFHPYQYGGYLNPPGDAYTKKTCLWAGGGFVMPFNRPIASGVDDKLVWYQSPSKERGNIRSVTPAGFARAVFEANALKSEMILTESNK